MNSVLLLTAVNGFLVVMLGAFGAHGLEGILTPERLETWNTAVLYHMFHILSLFGVGLLGLKYPDNILLKRCAILLMAGIALFSGSLYLLAITGFSKLGMITPIGGIAFLSGWVCLFLGLLKNKSV